MRKPATIALIASVLLQVSCGGRDSPPEPILLWLAAAGEVPSTLQDMVREYNAGPGRDAPVHAVPAGRGEEPARRVTLGAAPQPDLVECSAPSVARLAQEGMIGSLSPLLRNPGGLSEESENDLHPLFLRGASHDGVLYSFPFRKSVRCLYTNRDLLEQAGLERPPVSWSEYREWARRLSLDRDGDGERWGLGTSDPTAMFVNLLLQNGGSLISPDGTRAAFGSPEGIEALAFLEDLLVKDKTVLVAAGSEHVEGFLSGAVAMLEESTTTLPLLEGRISLGMAPLPAGLRATQAVQGSDVVILAEDPTRRQRAWRFVRWLTETPQSALWSARTGQIPVRRSASEHPDLAERLAQVPGLADAYAQVDAAVPGPKTPRWPECRDILRREAVEPVLAGTRDPAAALSRARELVEERLARR